jgi:hypothetical protein
MAGLLSLAGALTGASSGFLQEEVAHTYIIPLDIKGSPDMTWARSFQFWPAEMTDNEAVNYATKQIPGGNLPFYQWVSGGEHVVSFSAIFARDLWAPNVTGTSQQGIAIEETKHTVDVAAAVKWLRTLKAPRYVLGNDYPHPPPLLYLVVPGTPIGVDMQDRMLCVMTQCDVTYKKWFPDGTPRLAEVSLAFAETIQKPGNVQFYGGESMTKGEERYTYKKGIKPL